MLWYYELAESKLDESVVKVSWDGVSLNMGISAFCLGFLDTCSEDRMRVFRIGTGPGAESSGWSGNYTLFLSQEAWFHP